MLVFIAQHTWLVVYSTCCTGLQETRVDMSGTLGADSLLVICSLWMGSGCAEYIIILGLNLRAGALFSRWKHSRISKGVGVISSHSKRKTLSRQTSHIHVL